jgi:uncharacterized membrane protein SpoIIM required for sporulation
MSNRHFFNILRPSHLYETILEQNRKLLLASLLVFAAGGLGGCFGYEYFLTKGALAEGAFFVPPAELTALGYLAHNATVALTIMLGGILTLGAAGACLLFYNGVIVGESAAAALDRMPAGEVLVKIVPHGLFEVPALAAWLYGAGK